jgi:type II secretory pathway predicted ATPase ExeA
MYEPFFGFREKPFNLTPDPRFLYLGENHKEALARLVYGVKERRGFVVLSGEVGTGKTTIVRALLEQLDESHQIAYILYPKLSDMDFLVLVCEDLGLEVSRHSKAVILRDLHDFLLESHQHEKTTTLIIDEAQNLDPPLLEEIRLLTNLETRDCKLLQVFLIGQPELNDHLERRDLWQLKQRISVRFHLLPLDQGETEQYVRTRLMIAGAPRLDLFTEPAIRRIHAYSGGIPRLINNICDKALLTAFSTDRRTIDEEIVHECVDLLRLPGISNGAGPWERIRGIIPAKYRALSMALLFVVAGCVVLGSYLFSSHRVEMLQTLWRQPEETESVSAAREEKKLTKPRPVEPKLEDDNGMLAELHTEIGDDSVSHALGFRSNAIDLATDGEGTVLDSDLGEEEEWPEPPSEEEVNAEIFRLSDESTGEGLELFAEVEPKTVGDDSESRSLQPAVGSANWSDSTDLRAEPEDPAIEPEGEERVLDWGLEGEEERTAVPFEHNAKTETLASPDESLWELEKIPADDVELQGLMEEPEMPAIPERPLEDSVARSEESLLLERGQDEPSQERDVKREPKVEDHPEGTERRVEVSLEPSNNNASLAKKTMREPAEESRKNGQMMAREELPEEKQRLVKITDKEVRAFFEDYVAKYNRKDIQGFLALFSVRAIHNGKDDFREIERSYSRFFDHSRELRYHLKNTKIGIHRSVSISGAFFENAAEVKARYEIGQVLKEGREETVWEGDIRCFLVRENGDLRIRSLDYHQESSPSGRQRRPTKRNPSAFRADTGR